MVYGCGHGADLSAIANPSVAVLELPCIAMLAPSFIDFMLTRHYVDGVFLTGCHAGDCYERLGARWMQLRVEGKRDPRLRERVNRDRIVMFWSGVGGGAALAEELAGFQARLRAFGATGESAGTERRAAVTHAG
jgi:coenzyme F420-reducing hydrogenase delta subunit